VSVRQVLYNIGGPLANQLKNAQSKNGIAASLGLGAAASLLIADQADAVTEVAQLAASDNRIVIIAGLFLPVLGWVSKLIQPISFRLICCPCFWGVLAFANYETPLPGSFGLRVCVGILARSCIEASDCCVSFFPRWPSTLGSLS
jgi:hypothetical protein